MAYSEGKEIKPKQPKYSDEVMVKLKEMMSRFWEDKKLNTERGGVDGEIGPKIIPKEKGATIYGANFPTGGKPIPGTDIIPQIPTATTNLQGTFLDQVISPTAKGIRASLNAIAKKLGFNAMGKYREKPNQKDLIQAINDRPITDRKYPK